MSFVYHDRDDHPKDYWPPAVHRTGSEAAHAATPLPDDQDAWEPVSWPELIRLAAPFVIGVAAVVALALYGWR